ncbi:MAG: hypothetical protein M3Y53_12715, partial [Thermoproteota archaeon]|nr:hypothetical protein [Thermoproteota archaeon]
NVKSHLNLLYHAELQRRTMQQIQAQNKCYDRLYYKGLYFRTRVLNVTKDRSKFLFLLNIFQNSSIERYKR